MSIISFSCLIALTRTSEKGTTEDEMAGWHHQLDRHEFEQALGVVMDREAWRAAVHGSTTES